ncbi:MAG: LacI family DNA-binding transcriptional regulator [Planctomycetota bacterium]|jgi:LacI family transcriptional regulator
MVQLKDIAEATGFSVRTVNRVLKNNGVVNEKTRLKIEECVKEMGYRPNLIARSLSTGKSHSICLVIDAVDELNFSRVSGFENYFRTHGYIVNLIFALKSEGEDEPEYISSDNLLTEIMKTAPEGIAIIGDRAGIAAEVIAHAKSQNIPHMTYMVDEEGVDTIMLERSKGIYDSINYLIEKGYQRIAYMGRRDRDRFVGYNQAIEEAGREPIHIGLDAEVINRNFYKFGLSLIDEFLALDEMPDAVQCYSDQIAFGFMSKLHEKNIRIPEDVAVVGYNGLQAATMSYPRLTTVGQPKRKVGIRLAEILLKKINGEDPPEGGWSTTAPTELFIREST